MASAPGLYPLLRGSDQVIRVNIVQYMWLETLAYVLHPEIPQDVKKVADVATATGLWLCNLSRTRNDLEILDGYDISPASFLPSMNMPSKVILQSMDATQPAPESLRGMYDVVHVRLIQPGVQNADPSPVIEHCMQLLRPGGYLQWEEFDLADFEVHNAGNVPTPSHLEFVAKKLETYKDVSWIARLPQLLEAKGMSILAVDRKREPAWHHLRMAHLLCGVVNEIARVDYDVRGPPGAGDELRERTRKALEEAMAGSHAAFRFQAVVAKKPE